MATERRATQKLCLGVLIGLLALAGSSAEAAAGKGSKHRGHASQPGPRAAVPPAAARHRATKPGRQRGRGSGHRRHGAGRHRGHTSGHRRHGAGRHPGHSSGRRGHSSGRARGRGPAPERGDDPAPTAPPRDRPPNLCSPAPVSLAPTVACTPNEVLPGSSPPTPITPTIAPVVTLPVPCDWAGAAVTRDDCWRPMLGSPPPQGLPPRLPRSELDLSRSERDAARASRRGAADRTNALRPYTAPPGSPPPAAARVPSPVAGSDLSGPSLGLLMGLIAVAGLIAVVVLRQRPHRFARGRRSTDL